MKMTTFGENMKKVTAAEANRRFSALLKEVAKGERVLVTSHGEPVATMLSAQDAGPEREAARQLLLRRLRSQKPLGAPSAKRNWTRDELYDESKSPALRGSK